VRSTRDWTVVEIGTNVNGTPIGDSLFEPFFAACGGARRRAFRASIGGGRNGNRYGGIPGNGAGWAHSGPGKKLGYGQVAFAFPLLITDVVLKRHSRAKI